MATTPQIVGDTTGLKPEFLQKVLQAAGALGASQLIIHSGYRSPSHNAAVGGVSHSNHLTGEAIDGYVVVNGQQIPLGTALRSSAGQFGLRSGDQPGFYHGAPDTVHVDDAANMGGVGTTTNIPTATPANSGVTTNLPTAPANDPLISALLAGGFSGKSLPTAWAIARRESSGNPRAFNPNRATGDQSYGLFQINMLGDLGPSRRQEFGIPSNEALFDPVTNAKAAFKLSKGGTDFGPWGVGPNAYRRTAPLDTSGFPGVHGGAPVTTALSGGNTRTTLAATPPVPTAPRALPAAVRQALAILRS